LASAPFAERLSREAGIATAAVGVIPDPKQADDIVQKGQLDVVLLAPDPQHSQAALTLSHHLPFYPPSTFILIRRQKLLP
jgi:hypothetical protein